MKKGIVLLLPLLLISFLTNAAFAGMPERKSPNPWMIYIGGFGGIYSADFGYGANYFSNRFSGSNQAFNNDAFQQGYSGGAQAGFQYHFQNPYYLGLAVSAMSDSDKAHLSVIVDNPVGAGSNNIAFMINHEFRVHSNLDITALMGVDITAQTHLYAKVGASYARFADKLFTTQVRLFPTPIPFFIQTRKESVWGWVVGLGLTQDLNKWVSAFLEYDHYDYGRPNLNTVDNIAPDISAGARDRLTQHVAITANAVRLGFNIKFMDTFSAARYLAVVNPWMIYVGGFGGYYSVDFGYGGNYFETSTGVSNPSNKLFNDDAFQQGYSGGAQVGIQYHFQTPYYVGAVISAMGNANKARLIEPLDDGVIAAGLTSDIHNEFRVQSNLDIAVLIGADITAQTHLYAKVGASYARFAHQLFTTQGRFSPFPIPFFRQTQKKNVWGWMLGLGLTRDLNKWVSAFLEYDHYDYGRPDLKTLDNIAPDIGAGGRDFLTQRVAITANSVRIGFNVKFMDSFSVMRYFAVVNPWMIYFGGFGGYYCADFSYGANYFTTNLGGSNLAFHNDAFQQGVSGGAQVGIQYHFQTPYYLGAVVSVASNANKASLVELLENSVVPAGGIATDINQEFRVQSNLDIAALIGADITAQTHLYVKVGASCARFANNLFITQAARAPFPIPSVQQTEKKNLWGWVVGLGLTRDLNKWVNMFLEYDHYDYGALNLRSLNNFTPLIPAAQRDRLTQHVTIMANSIRIGLNVKFQF